MKNQISEFVRNLKSFEKGPFLPGITPIPVSGKVIGEEEIALMIEAALDGWLTTGRFNEAFEKRLATFLGVRYLLTVNSGSSANLVAFSTLTSTKLGERAIRKGDEVITVAVGFPTTVNPIMQFGAIPVFIDADPITYNIDTDKIEMAISPRTKAIMIAHALGNPFNLDAITAICKKYNLWLVEDCCDALGSVYDERMVGTFGDIGTLSFYPAHHITMGEGGAVFTNNSTLKVIAESIRDWGRDCYCQPGVDNTCRKRFSWTLGSLPEGYDHKYIYSHSGYNLKITDMQAACGLGQLDRLHSFIDKRKSNFQFLYKHLEECSEYLQLPEASPKSDPSWFGFPMTIRQSNKFARKDLINVLDKNKIGTRLLFAGNITKQPYMQGQIYRISGNLTEADRIMNDTFWVGIYPGLGEDELKFVAETIKNFFK